MTKIYERWDADKLYDLYINQEYTMKQMAYEYDVSPSTISRALKYHDVHRGPVRNAEEIESAIRYALGHVINPYLAKDSRLPVAQPDDDDPDLWKINDYDTPEGGNDFPCEITLRYDRIHDTIEVENFELRGKTRNDLQSDLSRYLS